MENKERQCYEAPSAQVIEVAQKRVICASPDYSGFGDEEEM